MTTVPTSGASSNPGVPRPVRLALLAACALTVVAGLVTAWPSWIQATSWTRVEATAGETRIETRSHGTGKGSRTLYRVEWTFRYEADGHEVVAVVPAPYETGNSKRLAAWQTRYPRGSRHQIRRDPGDPGRASVARLDYETFLGSLAFLLVATPLLLLALALPEKAAVPPPAILDPANVPAAPRAVRMTALARIRLCIFGGGAGTFSTIGLLAVIGELELTSGVPHWVAWAIFLAPLAILATLPFAIARSRELVANGAVVAGRLERTPTGNRQVVYEVAGNRHQLFLDGKVGTPGPVLVFHDPLRPERAVAGSRCWHEPIV